MKTYTLIILVGAMLLFFIVWIAKLLNRPKFVNISTDADRDVIVKEEEGVKE